MAKYGDLSITDATFVADSDLTLAQYYFVVPASTAGNVKLANGASNPTPYGILQNSPSAGQEAKVRMLGISKLFCVNGSGSAIGVGRYLTTNASGYGLAIATESGSPILARNLDAAAPISTSRFIAVFLLSNNNACNISAC